jgi:plasmid stabilization system protein ParE
VKIFWSPLAIERVLEIAAWIATDRPEVAERVVDGIFEAVERLAKFPRSGRQVPEFERPEIRELIHRPYRIIYRVGPNRIDILTVRHSVQLLDEEDL